MLYTIIIIIIIIALIGIIVINTYNNFQFAIIKIGEAENNIDVLLEKKLELLNRITPILDDENKEKFSKSLEKIKPTRLNNLELNNSLKDVYSKLLVCIDDNVSISDNDKITKLTTELEDNEDELDGAIKFYNDNVVIFNKLIHCFPSNIIRLFFGYRKKDFYNNEKEEMLEILKK